MNLSTCGPTAAQRAPAPYFLRLLEEETGLDPQVKERLPTVLMASDELSFSVD